MVYAFSILTHTQVIMCDTSRQTVISTSEFGLYSDRNSNYRANYYGNVLRKSVIGVMAVIAAILIGILLYDFAASTSGENKIKQETKHAFILQKFLKRSNGTYKQKENN
ncbi:uncharacterized protein LOC122501498 [Leptopilina heterotoma]|uniref:uncharacterized protein LOC122501498 n=1 Tax=Leptopilina heterotoma TaxID=63436 RepID=UPI001CA9AFF7|nr:uncharacterized protein LOC122501498 [Leptopilina heterotoma]